MVQLNFTSPEVEVYYVMFDRSLLIFSMTSLKQNIWITSISGVISSWTSLLLNSEKDVAPKKRGKTKGTREIIFLSSLSLGDRLQEREEEVVVGGDDEQSGAEVEGDHHAPQVPPGRDARHGADRRHHVEHLQVRRSKLIFKHPS